MLSLMGYTPTVRSTHSASTDRLPCIAHGGIHQKRVCVSPGNTNGRRRSFSTCCWRCIRIRVSPARRIVCNTLATTRGRTRCRRDNCSAGQERGRQRRLESPLERSVLMYVTHVVTRIPTQLLPSLVGTTNIPPDMWVSNCTRRVCILAYIHSPELCLCAMAGYGLSCYHLLPLGLCFSIYTIIVTEILAPRAPDRPWSDRVRRGRGYAIKRSPHEYKLKEGLLKVSLVQKKDIQSQLQKQPMYM